MTDLIIDGGVCRAAMEEKMKSLMMELKEQNILEKEVRIIDNVVSD